MCARLFHAWKLAEFSAGGWKRIERRSGRRRRRSRFGKLCPKGRCLLAEGESMNQVTAQV